MPGTGATSLPTQRHVPKGRSDENRLVTDMIELKPESMADTAIAELQPCSEKQVGPSAMDVLNGSGDERG